MSETPSDHKYTESHEWVRVHDDTAIIGITDHAQEQLGDIVFVELPETGKEVKAGDVFAVIESVKAASDIYAPISGEVVEINSALESAPEKINEDPHGEGWITKIKISDKSELESLLNANEYKKHIDAT